MTAKEKAQPHVVFVEAGKKSFQIGVHIMNNPYPLQPFHTLWEKGYRKAKRTYDEARFAAQRKEASGDQVAATKPAPATVPNTVQPVSKPRRNFKELQAKMSPASQAKVAARVEQTLRPPVYRIGTIGSIVGSISLADQNVIARVASPSVIARVQGFKGKR